MLINMLISEISWYTALSQTVHNHRFVTLCIVCLQELLQEAKDRAQSSLTSMQLELDGMTSSLKVTPLPLHGHTLLPLAGCT